jgi:hypothetical protein
MSQSGLIGATLIAGFVLWLAMNKKLTAYWAILMGGAPGSGGTRAPGPQIGSGGTGPQSGPGASAGGAPAANYTPVTTPPPGSNPFGAIGSA